ncbi:hypothetical protein AVEN_205209-1 [Araneus ventricosus]|uniref:Uncharacterized protein n=1 Tax=Araneus ventricosus TaxID=182803 RepID=A0A4Y2WCI9_ARAVE|nr:hypothetical protein AVEN_205209-1 [Araneus ventricosus]
MISVFAEVDDICLWNIFQSKQKNSNHASQLAIRLRCEHQESTKQILEKTRRDQMGTKGLTKQLLKTTDDELKEKTDNRYRQRRTSKERIDTSTEFFLGRTTNIQSIDGGSFVR